jgi:uncharacterized delta-60 repeat protein
MGGHCPAPQRWDAGPEFCSRNRDQRFFEFAFLNDQGELRRCIARLNLDGTLDSSFVDPRNNAEVWGWINSVSLQSDGKVLMGGWFMNVNGTGSAGIARLNSDGTLDLRFNPGAGPDMGRIHSMALQPSGMILVAGDFRVFDGVPRNGVARLHGGPAEFVRFQSIALLPDRRVRLIGTADHPGEYEIQATTNLLDWTPLGFLPLNNGAFEFIDPDQSTCG